MKIVFLLDNPFVEDRRVHREAKALTDAGHQIILFAVEKESAPLEEVIDGIIVKRIFPLWVYDVKKRRRLNSFVPMVLEENPVVVHCHDQLMLDLGARIKKAAPGISLIYDSHELFHSWPLSLLGGNDLLLKVKSLIVRKLEVFFERRNARFIDHLVTVNHSLANDLKKYFCLENNVTVVRNLPEKQDFPRSDLLRKEFKLKEETKILVFIGASVHAKTLNLEQVILEFADKPNVDFIIICGEGSGKKEVKAFIESHGYRNIYFHPKLKPGMIGPYLASANVGLVPTWNKKDLSYWFALDNKLFEYLMSGIPILATKQPEYVDIVEKFSIGRCVDPDQENAYYKGFLDIMDNYREFTEPLKNAKDVLNWENERHYLTELYKYIEARTMLRLVISYDKPGDPVAWNELALDNGSLLQSTIFDLVHTWFKETPVYFEIWDKEIFCGGVKLYYFVTGKIPGVTKRLSKSLTQFGGFLVKGDLDFEKEMIEMLTVGIREFIRSNNIVQLSSKGYYDRPELILKFDDIKPVRRIEFINTHINLTQTEEQLWQRIHKHHQQEIKKAGKHNLVFSREDNWAGFKELFLLTYQGQSISGPDLSYLEFMYNSLKETGHVNLFFARCGEEYLSATMSYAYGKVADYSFSGTKKNNLGTGAFLQWEIMKYYKERGFEKYFLGQVTKAYDPSNPKFSEHISWFKREFDPEEIESFSSKYIFRKYHFLAWEMLRKTRRKF